MMRPPCPCAIMARPATCAQRKAPVRSIATTSSHSASVSSTAGARARDTRRIDEDIHATEGVPCTVNERLHLVADAHVAGDGQGLPTEAADGRGHLLQPSGIDIGERNVGAEDGEPPGNGFP